LGKGRGKSAAANFLWGEKGKKRTIRSGKGEGERAKRKPPRDQATALIQALQGGINSGTKPNATRLRRRAIRGKKQSAGCLHKSRGTPKRRVKKNKEKRGPVRKNKITKKRKRGQDPTRCGKRTKGNESKQK